MSVLMSRQKLNNTKKETIERWSTLKKNRFMNISLIILNLCFDRSLCFTFNLHLIFGWEDCDETEFQFKIGCSAATLLTIGTMEFSNRFQG